jgi:MFS transporter, AAHS family, benzoate transport protein
MTPDSELEARRLRTVLWVVGLATPGLIFDGYDLVVYGTVISIFLKPTTTNIALRMKR